MDPGARHFCELFLDYRSQLCLTCVGLGSISWCIRSNASHLIKGGTTH